MMALFDRNPQKTSDVPIASAATIADTATAAGAPGANLPSALETRRPSAKPTFKPAETQGSQLIVGPNIKLKGTGITDCDTLTVEGHGVFASGKCQARRLQRVNCAIHCHKSGMRSAQNR